MTINMAMGQILVLIVVFIVAAAAAVVVVPQTTTSTFFTSALKHHQKFIAELKSEMVVPSISNNATGTAYFQLDMKDNNKIKYSLIATDLDNVKAAHIHIGKEGEKNGPTIVTLYKTLRPAVLFGRILSVHDIITSDTLEGPLAGKKLSDLVNIMNNMMAYVDIHSQEYPNGELRGQISTTTGMSS
ncbi:MAG: CHRD domain-containing protein [Thermoproteota archaeon]|jgi:hypothetical protein|nr:CHRD domain-containing protein [Thermoproteota archaeon]